jgi:sulfate adenylyltransferase
MKQSILPPHGGCGLVNRIIPEMERERIQKEAENYPIYNISNADLSVFYRMSDGALSPLEGPMDSKEFNQVLDEEVIERNGSKYAWTIPLAFPVAK